MKTLCLPLNQPTMAAAGILFLAALAMPPPPQQQQMMQLSGGGPHLAIDPSAVANTSGLKMALGPVQKDKKNPFFGEDKPWDVAW